MVESGGMSIGLIRCIFCSSTAGQPEAVPASLFSACNRVNKYHCLPLRLGPSRWLSPGEALSAPLQLCHVPVIRLSALYTNNPPWCFESAAGSENKLRLEAAASSQGAGLLLVVTTRALGGLCSLLEHLMASPRDVLQPQSEASDHLISLAWKPSSGKSWVMETWCGWVLSGLRSTMLSTHSPAITSGCVLMSFLVHLEDNGRSKAAVNWNLTESELQTKLGRPGWSPEHHVAFRPTFNYFSISKRECL